MHANRQLDSCTRLCRHQTSSRSTYRAKYAPLHGALREGPASKPTFRPLHDAADAGGLSEHLERFDCFEPGLQHDFLIGQAVFVTLRVPHVTIHDALRQPTQKMESQYINHACRPTLEEFHMHVEEYPWQRTWSTQCALSTTDLHPKSTGAPSQQGLHLSAVAASGRSLPRPNSARTSLMTIRILLA